MRGKETNQECCLYVGLNYGVNGGQLLLLVPLCGESRIKCYIMDITNLRCLLDIQVEILRNKLAIGIWHLVELYMLKEGYGGLSYTFRNHHRIEAT